MGTVKKKRTTKLAEEIEVGDTVYVAHSRQRWIRVTEVQHRRLGGYVWIRGAETERWSWLEVGRTYPVRP